MGTAACAVGRHASWSCLLGSAGMMMWDLVRRQPCLDSSRLWASFPSWTLLHSRAPGLHGCNVIPADVVWCVYWEKTLARVAGLADLGWTGSGTLKCQLGVEPWLVRSALRPKDKTSTWAWFPGAHFGLLGESGAPLCSWAHWLFFPALQLLDRGSWS